MQHPRSSLMIVIQLIQDCGSCASAVMTFAFDSINQNMMTSSTSGKFTFQQVQLNTIKIEFYVSWKPLKNLFSWPFVAYYIYMVQFSFVHSSQYDKCLEACRSAAIKLFDFFRLSVERKLSKDAKFMDLNIA
ncbi:hypothetical protein P5673_024820 [Acropora cervicornis]|uniref:Uncharacterized protein n=1 Tax=Acropora cervicornis TaxID=6130 RepID=A0AAD9UXY5_ACRCE|nr:hypothetical protein P5673_024820 [Acropora cervicornis]